MKLEREKRKEVDQGAKRAREPKEKEKPRPCVTKKMVLKRKT
jgi:hypothetical protein